MKSTANYRTRHQKLGLELQLAEMKAMVLNPGPSLTYLTGLHFHLSERPVIFIFVPHSPPVIVLPELEAAKLKSIDYPFQAFPYTEDLATWVDAFRLAARAAKIDEQRVGIEPRGLRYLELNLLQQAAPNVILTPADEILAKLRMVKDDKEAEYMQAAAQIAETALQKTLNLIKPGKTEKEIAAALTMQLLQNGSNPQLPFFPIVSGGPNSANPHAAPSDRPLQTGDLLVIDYGASVEGYLSDITRTFAIGPVEPEFEKIAEIVLAANTAGRAAVKPGVTAASIDLAAREVITQAGYGQYFIHRTGHGLGVEGHEYPYLRADNTLLLTTGMTFTVEPGIYLPDRGGVRIEDDVIVTTEGVHSFTSLPRELITL